jgi:hypothetical protein
VSGTFDENVANQLTKDWGQKYGNKMLAFICSVPYMPVMQILGYTDLLNKTFPGTEPKKNNE